ncbi:uncharacterized protein L969DRAFT_53206 [Mixia osmundae IAM 14324]|uniref:Uncharacterized protein n=1 Tax=Mixia osmundae (strain CBS 9802 / IAM 14324 / JCM 22182 / KY 12970) TaxID=764103 RepID=G7DV14_MIXOS|nr:uncharacterized protein L969DRAFT_53206 [Mixia osmundae IAM 14324]KEI37243.1 hypothetical protein L969DRAFT_53206 [Mixia osmundae IAM 14324]GAA94424.1 hypothetical protein E5Q_01076 [Mixia osmundae IAM 14324]
MKHQEGQNSLHADLPGSQVGPSRSSGFRRTANVAGPQTYDPELEQRFFGGQNASGSSSTSPGPEMSSRARADSAFALDQMRREVESMQYAQHQNGFRGSSAPGQQELARMEAAFRQQASRDPSVQGNAWRQAFEQPLVDDQLPAQIYDSGAVSDFAMSHRSSGLQSQRLARMGGMGMSAGMGMGLMGMGSHMGVQSYGSSAFETAPAVAKKPEGKGKGRFVELGDDEWEAQFERAAPVVENSQQKDETVDLTQGELELDGDQADADLLRNLEQTWKGLSSSLNGQSASDKELAAWEAQYGSQFVDSDLDLNLASSSEDPRHYEPFNPAQLEEYIKNPPPYPYEKEAENKYTNHPDPFQEGQRLLQSGAPLSEAAMAFEAACRLDEQRGEAWRALGDTLAADERELKAIRALERAVGCPGEGGDGTWMSLAISYVNEGQDLRALATLERWLNATYPDTVKRSPQKPRDPTNPWDGQERMIDLFLAAARSGPTARTDASSRSAEPVDADVQVGLGVLFYSNSDFVRAKDCFEAALSVRPDDFLLWNRLGATLANGGSPELAIDAYRKALELRPTFTRAIYNLGVSCLNINCYQEAAEHLLSALDLHRRDGDSAEGNRRGIEDDGSSNLWNTLRRAFLCMERHDLADRALPGGDVDSFRKDELDMDDTELARWPPEVVRALMYSSGSFHVPKELLSCPFDGCKYAHPHKFRQASDTRRHLASATHGMSIFRPTKRSLSFTEMSANEVRRNPPPALRVRHADSASTSLPPEMRSPAQFDGQAVLSSTSSMINDPNLSGTGGLTTLATEPSFPQHAYHYAFLPSTRPYAFHASPLARSLERASLQWDPELRRRHTAALTQAESNTCRGHAISFRREQAYGATAPLSMPILSQYGTLLDGIARGLSPTRKRLVSISDYVRGGTTTTYYPVDQVVAGTQGFESEGAWLNTAVARDEIAGLVLADSLAGTRPQNFAYFWRFRTNVIPEPSLPTLAVLATPQFACYLASHLRSSQGEIIGKVSVILLEDSQDWHEALLHAAAARLETLNEAVAMLSMY